MKQFDCGALPIIYGQNVLLRPIKMEDTDQIVKWRNSPAVKKNFIFRGTMTAQIHHEWIKNKVITGQVVQYIIEDVKTGKSIGSVYYRDIDYTHESAEYGIFIGEESARGRGLGSETAKLFVDFGFSFLGLHRISLRVLEGNNNAYRSYEKAGFRQEGVFRDMVKLDGLYRNVIFMAVIAE